MRPITLNPTLIHSFTTTRSPRLRQGLERAAHGVGLGLRHVLYLPQVIVALPVLLLVAFLDR